MEKCFWCGCEIIEKPNYIKYFGYVCDKDYAEMGYSKMDKEEQQKIVEEFAEKLINSQKDTTPEFEKTFWKNYRKLLAKFDENGISEEKK